MILEQHTDEVLRQKIAEYNDMGVSTRRFELLLEIPAALRAQAEQDATRQMNMVPGERYSDCIASAVHSLKSRGPIAQLMHAASFGATTQLEGAMCASTVEYIVYAQGA